VKKLGPLAALSVAIFAPQFVHAAREIRFCPSTQVRPYPLNAQRDIKGLLLHNIAIVNRDGEPLRVTAVTIELLAGDSVVDSRRLAGTALDKIAERGKKLEASGTIAAIPFQFCGRDLIRADETLGTPTLAHNQALLVTQQVFGYNGARDRVRVRIDGKQKGKAVVASGTLPIVSGFSKKAYLFPLRGAWYVGNGTGFNTDHRWVNPEEFAFDMLQIGADGLTHSGDGRRFTDYHAYGADVLAMGEGKVVQTHDGEAEDPKAMQQPGESDDAYGARLRKDQAARLARGTGGIAGNFVMIDHGGGEFSLYAHMQKGSVRVKESDAVRAGEVLGKLGSSGNSTEPHLHFQLCDHPDPLMCAGIPIQFSNVQGAVQSGDVVIAK